MFIDDLNQDFVLVGAVLMRREEWLKLQPAYALDPGYVRQDYDPDAPMAFHILTRADGSQALAETPWAMGDFYLRTETQIARRLDLMRGGLPYEDPGNEQSPVTVGGYVGGSGAADAVCDGVVGP